MSAKREHLPPQKKGEMFAYGQKGDYIFANKMTALSMIKVAPLSRPEKKFLTGQKKTDEDLIALVEAFQYFNRNTTALSQAYRRLEGAAQTMAEELEQTNLELQQKNAELDRANGYLEDILASIGSGVVVADLEGRVTTFNRMAEELTGYAPGEVIGQNYHEFLAGELGQDAPLVRTLIMGEPVVGCERELPHKNGGTITVKSSSAWLTSSSGERIGVIETIEDVSQIRALEKRMLHQRTLAALGEMAAQVAHELRNPLAGIKGFAGLLSEDLPADHPSRRMVNRISEGVDSLDRIASNLLILTQDCQGEFNRQPLEPIFEQAISLIEVGAGNACHIKRDFPQEACSAKVDSEKIKQLLLNLLKNAWEATEGKAEVVAGYRANALSNELRIFVRDFGPGVPPDVRDKIFSPFFTTQTRGTGLGLAIVKKIAELHRGRVEFSAPEGGGALFTTFLPIL
jgi:PAS domain S-box-containing protein